MKIASLKKEDYNPYYGTYIAYVKEEELKTALGRDLEVFQNFISNLSEEKLVYRYKNNKWTIAELIVHIIDTERIFQYRALCIARNDKSSLPGFEQDDYVANSESNSRSKESLLQEFISVRKATISLFDSFSANQLQKRGEASNSPLSTAAAGFIITGHLRHHLRILREYYF